jgi:hypothetical protein
MDISRERVISISLNESEWQKFVSLHPQPVNWIRERIQESLGSVTASSQASATAAANTTSATTR